MADKNDVTDSTTADLPRDEDGAKQAASRTIRSNANAKDILIDTIKDTESVSQIVTRAVRLPCARDSLLIGIASGLATGLLAYYRRPNVLRSCNFAVGAFALLSSVSWEICYWRQRQMRQRGRVFVDQLKQVQPPTPDQTLVASEDINNITETKGDVPR